MKSRMFAVMFMALFTCFSCEIINQADIEEVIGNRVAYYWIMADADTYVECVKSAGTCVPIEANYAGRPLVVAHNAHGVKRSYIDFPIPDFPTGTVIEEAYFEMFHSGKNEDGKTDDIAIDVSRVVVPWNANDIHYENQPVRPGNGTYFQLDLKSQDWSGSPDISFFMNEVIQNSTDFHGFIAFLRSPEPGYEKGFYSVNDSDLASNDFGDAPRLLLKVELPEGVSVTDIGFPERHPEVNGSSFFGSRVRQTNNWPEDWDLAIFNN